MTNLDSILKSRDITLPTKVHLVKAMIFPVVMYGGESWTIKKAEHQRNNAFEQWCWRRLLRVPWTARRSKQSIVKEISPEYSLEGLMLKLKLQYFGHLMQRTDSLEKILMLGKIEGRMKRGWGWDGWMTSQTRWTRVGISSRSWWWTERPGVLQFIGLQRVGHDWVTELNPNLHPVFPNASVFKNLPAVQEMQETLVWSLDWKDLLEKRHGNPLQYSCLETPMDWGAWWAKVQRVANIQTQLKQLNTHTITANCREFKVANCDH